MGLKSVSNDAAAYPWGEEGASIDAYVAEIIIQPIHNCTSVILGTSAKSNPFITDAAAYLWKVSKLYR